LVLLSLSITLSEISFAAEKNLQLQLGETVSIYSEKAYRKNKGTTFEAIGNVVIISGKDTLYGEKASLNLKTGDVEIEGNVRFISEGITIYGSKIDFNSSSGQLEMFSARIITSDFNIVANTIKKIDDKKYIAKKAEFTTCKDCTESWVIFGDEINIELNQYVKIKHALTKIKGVSVLYFPYIAIPIKNERESGILFPRVSTRLDEGIRYEQPIFWAINDSRDMTITPTFLARRGYGADVEYREAFGENKWIQFNNRMVNDLIFAPGKTDTQLSGEKYFRNFVDLETHMQWTNDLTQHFRFTGMKDLDMIRDYNEFTEEYLQDSDVGVSTFTELRSEWLNVGIEATYRRNLIVDDSETFDKQYVQTLPSVYFSTTPYSLLQSDTLFLQNISVGIDSDVTIFKQMNEDESLNLRNVRRLNAKPYLDWHLFNIGAVKAKTNYLLNYQSYDFLNNDESSFTKYAGVLTTELSFSMDKIFGLAYEDKVLVRNLKKDYLINNNTDKDKIKTKDISNNLIGNIPSFENSLTKDSISFVKNSYRHSQEFKLLHHLIANSNETGNKRFDRQIDSNLGWFDYDDAIARNANDLGTNATRTEIPLRNTIELQWNNSLIRKSPKKFNYFTDDQYLRDNFSYSKIGYFNISQGFTLDNEASSINERLTRLHLATGYSTSTWNVSLSDFFFHDQNDHILTTAFQRRFQMFSLLGSYNLNSLSGSNIETIRFGSQIRPIDTLGFSILKEEDLNANETISSIYQVDFMPNNNCWILNFNYRETVVDNRYSFNWVFNFGNDEFKEYRNNFFQFNRIMQ
jgi:LPS-assembly protein